MNPSILREFLVAIGFEVDQGTYKDFQAKFQKTVESFEKLSKIAAVAVTSMAAVGFAVLKTVKTMEDLYLSAQRAGTSVSSLMALRFGGEQAGVGADAVASAVERMSSEIRSNPGMLAFFHNIGVAFQPGQGAENFKNLIVALAKMNEHNPILARQYGQALGIDEQMLNTLFLNQKQFLKGMEDQNALLKESGLNAEQFGKMSYEASQNWNKLLAHVEILAFMFGEHVLPSIDRMVVFLTKALNAVIALDHATKGWSTTIGGVISALGGVLGSLKALSWLFGLAGGGGAAATAETAAGGAATGIMAPLAIAAADAALAWHDIKEGGKLYKTYRDSGTFTDMIKNFEGFSSRIYRDIAGHPTVGYGHQVRAGEDFSGGVTQAGALRLLAQDTMEAQQSVLRLVKVALNANQLKALTDFTFNVGAGAFAKSTLLKMLNAGDFSGAAEQFQRWNHAGGSISAGLTNRRLGERELFQRPDVNLDQTTTINVFGDNPNAIGKEVSNRQREVNGDLLRNMAPTVQ